ncbi:hypothetical protein AFL01nite_14580 [Aeromicrobium flavum]|uniref:DUF2975 domain-containing protein n=1 Tax=Aeromicrobium flavum TaxID=416568 RepID=A0A512HUL4_9ACTN|nr:DUF2975 domain-containing protein [Aeromicrobium flavum]GEO89131.1 hypothetical protein AFL01nite_14580 [Aeromicrobium flavum]
MKQPFGAARSDLWTAVVISVVVIVGTIVDAVSRIAEILPNRDVPVEVYLDAQRQDVAIPGVGERIPVELDHVTVRVSDLPPASLAAALGAVIVPACAVIAVMLCISWFCRNLASGQFFSRTNTRLVTATSFVILGGWLISSIATTMASNGALARLSPEAADVAVSMQFSFLYLFVAIIVGCLGAAFHAGERLQRETAGLV